jgi:hypothetical protein
MRRVVVLAGILAILVTACSREPQLTASPSSTPSPIPTEQLGPELDPAVAPGEAAGFALEVPEGIVLTTTRGIVLGHLSGWMLDRDRSDRRAAPVLTDPDGGAWVVTGNGLLPPDDPMPAADRHTVTIDDRVVRVYDPDGAIVATMTRSGPDQKTWVSATAAVVTVVDEGAVDVVAGSTTVLPEGCHVADRHSPDNPLLVCDAGQRIAGDTDVAAPDGARWAWVTTGTTGDEIVATSASGCGARRAWFGSRSQSSAEPLTEDGDPVASEALFVRSSGDAWVALLGRDCAGAPATAPGLYSRSMTDGTLERLGEPWPTLSGAVMWTR